MPIEISVKSPEFHFLQSYARSQPDEDGYVRLADLYAGFRHWTPFDLDDDRISSINRSLVFFDSAGLIEKKEGSEDRIRFLTAPGTLVPTGPLLDAYFEIRDLEDRRSPFIERLVMIPTSELIGTPYDIEGASEILKDLDNVVEKVGLAPKKATKKSKKASKEAAKATKKIKEDIESDKGDAE